MDLDMEAANLLDVFRTVSVALPCDNVLTQIGRVRVFAFNRACQSVLDYGSQAKRYYVNNLRRTLAMMEELTSCYQT